MIPRKYGKNAHSLRFIFLVAGGGGGGLESRPVDGGGGGRSAKKGLLKWPQNGVTLVGLDLDSVGYYRPTSSSVGRMCSVNIVKTHIGYALFLVVVGGGG